MLDFDDKINVILLDVDFTKICCKRPNGAMENALFVVDWTQLKSANDWLVSDVGSFEHRGSSANVYTILHGKILASRFWANKRLEDLVMEDGQYLVKNVFHRHKKYPDFLRTSTTILDCSKTELQLGLIEYRFKKGEYHVSPH